MSGVKILPLFERLPLGNPLYPHSPKLYGIDFKAVSPLFACLNKQLPFLVAR